MNNKLNGNFLEVIKQVPALSVLALLTYAFLTAQADQARAFTDELRAIRTEHYEAMRDIVGSIDRLSDAVERVEGR